VGTAVTELENWCPFWCPLRTHKPELLAAPQLELVPVVGLEPTRHLPIVI